MSAEPNFTKAQQDALRKAYEVLGEHFDGSVIIVWADTEIGGERFDLSRTYWSGGFFQALGLLHTHLERLSSGTHPNEVKPTLDEDDGGL